MNVDDLLYAPISNSPTSKLIIPTSWFNIVNAIQNYPINWRYATLAGGALRDLDLKRRIKDVDIFVPYSEDMADLLAEALSGFCLSYITEVKHDANGVSATAGSPASHFLFEYDGWHFEISQRYEPMHDYRHILDTFDIGLCMICLDKDNAVYRSQAYETDVKNETLTIVRETGGGEMAHAQRLLKKYQGWRVIPYRGNP